jgi:hypothetical protein
MQVPCQQKFWVALRANISFAHFGDQGMCAWARTLPQYLPEDGLRLSFRSMTGIVALSVPDQRGRTDDVEASSFKRILKGKHAR